MAHGSAPASPMPTQNGLPRAGEAPRLGMESYESRPFHSMQKGSLNRVTQRTVLTWLCGTGVFFPKTFCLNMKWTQVLMISGFGNSHQNKSLSGPETQSRL